VIREINRGFRVPEISLANFDDIAAMRLRLEPEAFRISVENGDDAWEERIIIAAHRLDRAAKRYAADTVSEVQDDWERCHRAFHEALIDACGSPMTLHFCGVLYDHFDRYRRLIGFDQPAQQRLAAQHRVLADCAVDRNVAEAEACWSPMSTRRSRSFRRTRSGCRARPSKGRCCRAPSTGRCCWSA
jgi:GntR family carbon starvation induced transcriptional regulator